ncbi:MAG TPA: hypothetical protein PKL14_03010 [Holophaga sp.]|nr:hypothetical protein [Holophaga sp.]
MKRICAWCGQEMPAKNEVGDGVTHGICDRCADGLRGHIGVPLQDFLDRFPFPVLATDDDVVVLAANRPALAMLGRPATEVLNRRGGEVFDCAESHLPEGCGRGIHCSGCAIRRAVFETHATGEPRLRVPATLRRGDLDAPESIALILTTAMKDGLVMLKLEKG